jgi:hypothetical protein
MFRIAVQLSPTEARSYLSALLAVASADGMTREEMAYIEWQARARGVSVPDLFAEPTVDLTMLRELCTPVTRRMIVRDCISLACLDHDYTAAEQAAVRRIAQQLGISNKRVKELEDWSTTYWDIMAKGDALVEDKE